MESNAFTRPIFQWDENDLGLDADVAPPIRLNGDYYFEPDDAQRGVSYAHAGQDLLGWPQSYDPYALDSKDSEGFGMEASCPAPLSSIEFGSIRAQSAHESPTEAVPDACFVDSSPPAEVPFGGVSATAVLLDGVSAAAAANCIYKFLTEELASTSIKKKRLQKFAINADVVLELDGIIHGTCSIKARVFSLPCDSRPIAERQLVIELRQMDGNPMIFADVFSKADRYLRERLLSVVKSPEPVRTSYFGHYALHTSAQPLEAEGMPPPECEALAPLLDALVASGHTGASMHVGPLCTSEDVGKTAGQHAQQAVEAVTGLVALARVSAASAAAICVALAGAHGALALLVASAQLNIAYPSARLAVVLAAHAMGGIAEPLLHAALVGVSSSGTSRLVRMELAEALKKTAFRDQPGGLLHRQLAELLRRPEVRGEELVKDRLSEAYSALENSHVATAMY